MTDTIEELYNGVIHPLDIVNGKVNLLTTDAVTRYVIKAVDVITSPSLNPAAAIETNGFKIAGATVSSMGSEIIGTNSSVDYVDSRLYLKKHIMYMQTTTSLVVDGIAQTIPALTGVVRHMVFAPNGDFYYSTFDGNSIAGIYKRTRGTSGVQSTDYTPGGYSISAFDGVSKFYVVTAINTLFVLDITTGGGTTHTVAGLAAGSTYPGMSYANGHLFWHNTYSSTTFTVIDVATFTSFTISGANTIAGAAFNLVTYESATAQYRFYSGTSYRIGSWLHSGYAIPATAYTLADPSSGVNVSNVSTYSASPTGIYYLSANNLSLRFQDYATSTPVTIQTFPTAPSALSTSPLPAVLYTLAESNATSIVQLRITGIKSV